MNGYQWTVLFAAWLGWGFDVFDGLLFNYVAPNCVPTLLGLPIGSVAASNTRWPPPTIRIRRPFRRPLPGASPNDSALGGRT